MDYTSSQISTFETLGNYLLFADEKTGQTIFDNLITSLKTPATGEGEEGEETPATGYTITNSLFNVTNDNTETSIEANGSYTANLTADSGYYISSIVVTMGGVNVTDTVYADGVITIAEVTGDVVIMASGAESDNLITAEILAETGAGTLPDGTNKDGTEISITPFIEVEPNVTYTHNLCDYIPDGHYSYELKIAQYDADKTYLGVYQLGGNGIATHTTGGTEKYVKLMMFTGHPNPYFGKSGVIV